MKIKKKHKITSLEPDDIAKRLRTDKLYYHCCKCGTLYEDKNRLAKICNLIDLGSIPNLLPAVFRDYKITSGLCNRCFEEKKLK